MRPESPAPASAESAPAGSCPACAGRLYPRELACADCGLLVRTGYRNNEFLELDDDSLHLLRIFIACEGRIRDMERALGVSYPTVKARLAGLRERLAPPATGPAPEPQPPPPASDVAGVLDQLESGAIDFDAAMRLLKGQS